MSSHHRTRQLLPQTLGQLWLAGIDVAWEGFYADQRRRRVPLPLYPFERQRYWIEAAWELAPATRRREDLRDWFAVPDWQRSALPATPTSGAGSWLLFRDDCGLGEEIAHQLTAAGAAVVTVSTEYEAPRSRLEERYARDWPPPSTWSTSLPAFRELVPDAYREKVAALVREIEDEGARDRGKRPVLGIEKILSQDRFKAPSK
ncbi:MAG: hypothetical protein GY856_11795, partial [bacterium]|nr:hypothetical protein [bacterium]